MLPEVRKILYCTDLSSAANDTLAQALYIAKKTEAEIYLLHLIDKLSEDARFTLETYVVGNKNRYDILRDRIKHAQDGVQAQLETFWQHYPEELANKHLIKSIHIAEAHAAEAILNVSHDKEIDLVIMGSHEKGPVHTFLGSVAKSVLNRSNIPVMVVPIQKKRKKK